MSALSPDAIAKLLKQEAAPTYERPTQVGPLRWFDKTMRCSSRGCSSPTNCKIQGIPRCMMHALLALNDLLIEKGVAE